MEKRARIKLNSVEKVEALLQEIYDDAIRQMTLIQNKISELEQSTNLSEETIDMKAKYAKSMHDYITDKEKAIGRKLDVSKLMTEVLKQNGDVEKVISDKEILNNLDSEFSNIRERMTKDVSDDDSNNDNTETYIINK